MREMKDSGVEWIGEIPKDWETRKIKYIATLAGRIGWQGLTSNEYSDEGAYLITGINFKGGVIDWESCVHIPMSRWEEAVQIQIHEGDLLITKDGTVGKVAIAEHVPGETSLNSGVLLIRNTEDSDTRFLFWMIQSEVFWKWFGIINAGNSTIIHLYQQDFYEFAVPFPELKKQRKISDYLDSKCSQIDAIIEKQQNIIEKLKEYKLSVITESVTKGVNPNVKLQESNIEWIASKPTEWKLVKIRKIAMTSSGSTPLRNKEGEYYQNATIPWIRTLDLNDGEVFESSEKITSEALKNSSCRIMPINTVCVAMYGGAGTIGKSGILRVEATTNQAICSMVCRDNMIPEYLLYQMQAIRKYWMKFAVGTRKDPNISQDIVSNMAVLLPPKYEQEKIVNEIKKRIKSIDQLICDKGKIVIKLQEYKKSLIYEVITGKMEV